MFTLVMTPNWFILRNSSRTFFQRGKGTLRGTNRENGLELGLNFIEYPSSNVLRPVKKDEYCSTIGRVTVYNYVLELGYADYELLAIREDFLEDLPLHTLYWSGTASSPRMDRSFLSGPYKILCVGLSVLFRLSPTASVTTVTYYTVPSLCRVGGNSVQIRNL